MIELWWLALGAVLAGPVWVALTFFIIRSLRRRTDNREHEQLVELGQLAGGLAHEIKNPLSTINVNLKLLSEDINRFPDEEHRRWLRRLRNVQAEADRMRGILDDFLHYAGKYELALKTVDLRRMVDELSDFFAPQADAANVVMRTMLPDHAVQCRVDSNLIKQAILNLMINSVQAIDEGGELIVKLFTARNLATIEIIDTGRGIPPEELEKIFRVYYSTKKQGTGLGLATTRRIIREHGGDINVASDVGKGTQFTITLPL